MSSPIDPEVLELLRKYSHGASIGSLNPFVAFFWDGAWSLRQGMGWGDAVLRGTGDDMLPKLRQLVHPQPTKAQLLKACLAAERVMFVSQAAVDAAGLLRRHIESLED